MEKFIKFISGRTFSSDYFVDSLLANLLGLQVFRFIAGRTLYNIKYFFYKDKPFALQKNGYMVFENFLSENEFLLLKKEYELAIKDENFSQKYIGYGVGVDAVHVCLDEKIKNKYPNLYKFSKNKKILSLFSSNALKKKLDMVVKIEKLEAKKEGDEGDASKLWHYDIYYNTFKAWLYLDDVGIEQGPLHYVAASHGFSLERLLAEWKSSIQYSLRTDKKFPKPWSYPAYEAGSKKYDHYNRISKKCTGKKNTVLFGNTAALHRRGDAIPGRQRNTIHFYVRESPFKILFG